MIFKLVAIMPDTSQQFKPLYRPLEGLGAALNGDRAQGQAKQLSTAGLPSIKPYARACRFCCRFCLPISPEGVKTLTWRKGRSGLLQCSNYE
jgi:hypothetical protein